jgi:ribokinase
MLPLYPQEGIKVKSTEVNYSLGGPVTAALILLSKLGVECTLVGSIGQDTYGEHVRKELNKYKITLIPHLQKVTKVNTVLVNTINASRTIIKDHITHSTIKEVNKSIVDDTDIIFFDRTESDALEYVSSVTNKDTHIVIDPSTEVSVKTMGMLRHASHVILPIESLRQILPSAHMNIKLKYLFNKFSKPIIINAGEWGSLLFTGKKIRYFPAYIVKAVDTLGAGDVFRGAFGYGLLQNYSLEQSIDYANKVAALQCTKVGNGTAIPTKKEIENFIAVPKTSTIDLNTIIYL